MQLLPRLPVEHVAGELELLPSLLQKLLHLKGKGWLGEFGKVFHLIKKFHKKKEIVFCIKGVPKGTDTFQSIIIEKLDNAQKFFSHH